MRSVSVTACWYVLTSNSFSMPVCRYPMSGRHFTMVSPSSSSARRSTPCVEGCCGPMFRLMLRGFAPLAATAADSGIGVATVSLTFVPVSNPVARYAVILAQRMPFPIVGQHDAPQTRMVAEPHAKQVERFPFEPVRAAPDFGHGVDLRIAARQAALQAQPLVPVERVQMIHHFKARLRRIPVHAGNGAQADKPLIVFQESAHAHDLLGHDLDGQLAPVELGRNRRVRVERRS